MTTALPLRQRLEEAVEDVSKHDLEVERKKLASLPDEELVHLEDAINAYATKKEAYLKSNTETETALLALRASVHDARSQKRSPAERIGAEYGERVAKIAEQTINRGSALAYNEWLKLQDPNHTTGYKALKIFGLAWGAYGLYRMAKWAWGKRGSSGLGRILKFTGLAAVAGWIVNVLGSEQEKKQASPKETNVELLPGLSLRIGSTPIGITERAKEKLLVIGDKTFRVTSAGTNVASLVTKLSESPTEIHIEGPSLLGIQTGGYIERPELERIVKILSNGTSTDLTVTYFDKPKTDTTRKAQQRSVRCEKV